MSRTPDLEYSGARFAGTGMMEPLSLIPLSAMVSAGMVSLFAEDRGKAGKVVRKRAKQSKTSGKKVVNKSARKAGQVADAVRKKIKS
jgi:hypothetical protein